ncbi:MAG TPA: hypothetical protein VG944_11420 [Fimbriimonas sp.]|nr:hypothetical protein [Fimbriimonas sp.]
MPTPKAIVRKAYSKLAEQAGFGRVEYAYRTGVKFKTWCRTCGNIHQFAELVTHPDFGMCLSLSALSLDLFEAVGGKDHGPWDCQLNWSMPGREPGSWIVETPEQSQECVEQLTRIFAEEALPLMDYLNSTERIIEYMSKPGYSIKSREMDSWIVKVYRGEATVGDRPVPCISQDEIDLLRNMEGVKRIEMVDPDCGPELKILRFYPDKEEE